MNEVDWQWRSRTHVITEQADAQSKEIDEGAMITSRATVKRICMHQSPSGQILSWPSQNVFRGPAADARQAEVFYSK